LGNLLIKNTAQSNDVKNYERSLDLNKALATVKYTAAGVEYTRETFVSYPAQLLVIRWKSSKRGALNFRAEFDNPMPVKVSGKDDAHLVLAGQCPAYVPHRAYEKRSIG